MHITDWREMLGEHFPLVVIGCTRIKNGAHSGGQKDVSVWKNTVRGTERSRLRPSFGQRTASGCR